MSAIFRRRRRSGQTPSPAPKPPKHLLPDAAFAVGASLYPLFIWALDQARLDGPAFFVLSSVRAGNRYPDENGRPARLHSWLTNTLLKVLGVELKRGDEVIRALHQGGLVQKIEPTEDRRKDLTDEDPSGERMKIVILTVDGEAALRRFNGYINECIDELLGVVPMVRPKTIAFLAHRLTRHEKQLITAAHKLAERKESERRSAEQPPTNPLAS